MGTKVSTIPRMRKVYSDLYANLPVTGVRKEDLGYATDREILYRWSGIAWETLTIYIGYGLAADKPAAALPDGCLYQETDTTKLMEVQAGAWVCIFYTGCGLAADKPAAADLPDGSQYQEQDTHKLMQVQAAAWVCIFYSGSGLAAAIPDPADMPEGALYFETDTSLLKQVQSAAWQAIMSIPAVLALRGGDIVRNSNLPERTAPTNDFIKVKEVLLNADLPACTIKFDLGRYSPDFHSAFGRVYKNGSAIGLKQSQNGEPVTKTQNFSGFVSGDLIQIYAHGCYGDEIAVVKNMKFCYERHITHIHGEKLATELQVTTDPTISMTNQDP
ncbi:hypothetical protein ES708_11983 [subsurface metagenome]